MSVRLTWAYSLLLGPISTLAWIPGVLTTAGTFQYYGSMAWVLGMLILAGTRKYSGMGTGSSHSCWDPSVFWRIKCTELQKSPTLTGSFNVTLTLFQWIT